MIRENDPSRRPTNPGVEALLAFDQALAAGDDPGDESVRGPTL